jgi:hypothetical protein
MLWVPMCAQRHNRSLKATTECSRSSRARPESAIWLAGKTEDTAQTELSSAAGYERKTTGSNGTT